MSKYDQCEHRLHCGTCVKTGKVCPHINLTVTPRPNIDIEPLPKTDWVNDKIANIPNCCVNCSNHPSNGGSGICNCVLPYMENTSILQGTVSISGDCYNGNGTINLPNTVTVYDSKIPHTYTDSEGIHG